MASAMNIYKKKFKQLSQNPLHAMRKPVLSYANNKAQISLHIRAVWSAPLLFAVR